MSAGTIYWNGRPLACRNGQSIAAILAEHGLNTFGQDELGSELRLFCGSGHCQCCLVRVDGATVEACITPARDGMRVESLPAAPDGGHDDAR